jgi:cobalt-precorrin 5A hydrolase
MFSCRRPYRAFYELQRMPANPSAPSHEDLCLPAGGPVVVAGLGCRRGCTAAALRELVEGSLDEHGLDLSCIRALASIDLKGNEPGLLELAEQLKVPLILFNAARLLPFEPQLTHRSHLAFTRTGCHGVAESAALALVTQLTGGPARLLISRRKSPSATFALACAPVIGG